jgi:hypothetical protein
MSARRKGWRPTGLSLIAVTQLSLFYQGLQPHQSWVALPSPCSLFVAENRGFVTAVPGSRSRCGPGESYSNVIPRLANETPSQ